MKIAKLVELPAVSFGYSFMHRRQTSSMLSNDRRCHTPLKILMTEAENTDEVISKRASYAQYIQITFTFSFNARVSIWV